MEIERENVFSKVFFWMFIGLLVSFGTSWYVFNNENMFYNVITKYFTIIIIVEVAVAFILSFFVRKMNPMIAKILFVLYSFLTGLTFSVIFAVFKMDSIITIFGVTSLLFLLLCIFGYTTKKDLTSMGNFLFFGLIGIIISSIINIFLGNAMFDIIICAVGVIIFIGYTAYDVKKIKELTYSDMNIENVAIIGAFELYLDFVNLFLKLLNLFGKRND